MWSASDPIHMARAIYLAHKGLYTTDPNPRVGCVLVSESGEVIGEGWHQRAGEAHAEIHALRQAASRAPHQIEGATAYVSLEPCCHHGKTPPCSYALINANLKRVVIAMLDPNPVVQGKGMAELQRAGIEVDVGIMPTQAEALNPGFVKRMQGRTPYVRLKVAMSLDGRTAMASGESQWITADSARQDGHRLRARSSAMLTGIGTVLHDDPSLTARLGDGIEVVQPLRVVLDSQLRMPATARMLTLKGKTLVYTQRSDDRDFKIRADGLIQAGVDLHMLESTGNKLDLSQVLRHLGDHYAVNEVMVEAGAKLNGALIDQQLVDEVVFYVAPVLMGDSALGAFNLPGITTMQQKIQLVNMRVRAVGEDLKIQAGVQYS